MRVVKNLGKINLKLTPTKCGFIKASLACLGHVVFVEVIHDGSAKNS